MHFFVRYDIFINHCTISSYVTSLHFTKYNPYLHFGQNGRGLFKDSSKSISLYKQLL